MNLVELLILLAFIFFPLLQGLLEKLGGNRRNGDQLPPEGEQQDYPEPIAMERQTGVTVEEAPAENEWSAGWGSWPSAQLPEELTVERPLEEEEAETFVRPRESVRVETLPEVVRVRMPAVSLEPVEVDRGEERQRVHARLTTPPPAPRRRQAALKSAFRSRGAVRQAVVLAEVLGPPRGLRSLEETRRE